MSYHTVIRQAQVVDGTGGPTYQADVGIRNDRVVAIAERLEGPALNDIDARGLCLAPGFIDVHTHDDLEVINNPGMRAKISQGVTSVIVGNCGISASAVVLNGDPPDPLNLLGGREDFVYTRFRDYARAVNQAKPSVNVAALVGHTALRSNRMNDFQRTANTEELQGMCDQLRETLEDGALGLSSGLAYGNAKQADTEEVLTLVKELANFEAVYTTHLRTEFDKIIEALDEALYTAEKGKVSLVVSHLKCAGRGNWGRSTEVLAHLDQAKHAQRVAWDCYPYTASSSTLDLAQVDPQSEVFITWSDPFPEQGGRTLSDIARDWDLPIMAAAEKLQPGGAVYHCMADEDLENILRHPTTMVGSDGLPNDPHPHPRLWGAFPRVLAHYCRDRKLFNLATAIHKMTGRSAQEFRLPYRGVIAEGHYADLVLFDFNALKSTATFESPTQVAEGIVRVWVNGVLTYQPDGEPPPGRGGRFLYRHNHVDNPDSEATP